MRKILVFSNNVSKSKNIKQKVKKTLESRDFIITKDDPDLILVIGGDGTMLSSIRQFNKYNVPFLGINTGSLGFLPGLAPENIDLLGDMLTSDSYIVQEFPLLEVTCHTTTGQRLKNYAFNEVVIRHLNPTLMEALLYIDNKPFNYYTGDGLIISTPVGTTGYAIWAGGAAMHDSLDVFQITPVNPNDNRINRPLKQSLIVPSKTRVDIRIIKAYKRNVQLACDGKSLTDNLASHITVKTSSRKVKILRSRKVSYFDLFRNKIIDKNISRYLEEENEDL